MFVLLLNGSPKEKGCTYTALNEAKETLIEEGIKAEIFQAGKDILPCRDCRACAKIGKCVINDKVNEFILKAKEADGFIFGSPVHYASASGLITSFLDRAFFASSMSGQNVFNNKPGAAIVSARRAGTTFALDQLNKYFMISQMPVISGRYWNMVHGNTPDEVKTDLEGMQNMRFLARNMAYYLKMKECAKDNVALPNQESVVYTNFIR